MGLKNGSLVTMAFSREEATMQNTGANLIMTSHCDGEEWGLEVVDLPPDHPAA